jgi:hypothetical protein
MISETRFGVCLRLREDDGQLFHNLIREELTTSRELHWHDGNQHLLLRSSKRYCCCCAQPGVKIVIGEGFFQCGEGGLAGAVARGDIEHYQ